MPLIPDRQSIYKSRYQRPDRKWICGKASQGCACPSGPDHGGSCPGYECKPSHVGDRWLCTRPDQYGGPCDSTSIENPDVGPIVSDGQAICCRKAQCTPTLSLRARRGRATWMLLAAIIGILLIVIGSNWRNTLITPGPLTTAHQGASFVGQHTTDDGLNAENCNACHDPLEETLGLFIFGTPDSGTHTSQSRKCLECHTSLADAPMNAHGISNSNLQWLSTTAQETKSARQDISISLRLASLITGSERHPDNQLACATCHQEHNGQLFDLTHMSQNQCQSCHTKQFQSFNIGHPDFGHSDTGNPFPFTRRTRIAFDHESHFKKHFRDSKEPKFDQVNCNVCHTFSSFDSVPRIESFGTMCATCHVDSISRMPDNPLRLYGLPSLQTEILDEEDKSVQNWPNVTKEISLSRFLLLFTSADEEYSTENGKTTKEQFEDDLIIADETFLQELFALDVFEDSAQLDAIQRLAQSIQRLNMQLTNGQNVSPLLARLKRMQSEKLRDTFNYAAMLGQLSNPKPLNKILDVIAKGDIVANRGHFTTEDGKASIASWKNKLEQVPQWIALTQALGALEAPPDIEFIEWFAKFDSFKKWFDSVVTIKDGRWLATSNGRKISSSSWKKLVGSAPGYGTLDSAKDTPSKKSIADFRSWLLSQSKFKKWLETSYRITPDAWYPSESPRSVLYRPLGHADPFIKEWIDYTASLYFDNKAAQQLFDDLTGRRAPNASPGRCIKCHAVDHEISLDKKSNLRVNWTRPELPRRFTKFNHSPHLKLLNCISCHDYNTPPANNTGENYRYKDSFRALGTNGNLGTDFLTFKSNFRPLTQVDCAKCHTAKKAGNSCLICHNYHIQEFTALSSTEL